MFRLLVFTFLYLSGLMAWSQSVFRIDSLPTNGVVLDKGWKWHPGDNPAWANADFDDTHWQAISPTQDIAALTHLPQQGIGWLRLRLHVASPLQGQAVGLAIQQIGATELFLNGHLTGLVGTINAHKQVETGVLSYYSPFMRLGSDSTQVIAVRYAFSFRRFTTRPFPFFRLGLLTSSQAEMNGIIDENYVGLEFFLAGLFLVLGVLQLLLYRASSEQRATLYLGLYMLTQGIIHLTNAFRYHTDALAKAFAVGQVALFSDVLFSIFTLSIPLASCFYLLGSYQYFGQPRKISFWLAATCAVATLAVLPLIGISHYFITMAVFATIIPLLDILRVGLKAIQQKQTGAKLFTIAHTFTLIVYIIWIVVKSVPAASRLLSVYEDYLFAISYIALALAISFLLAQERAATNRLLHRQLIELEVLSRKTIVQEQEKQQILATQNERLEQQVEIRTAELKASQAQLIQKEKLASLGELTAGIAHEIQNPLNFVNNFSEVSSELVGELTQEAQAGHTKDVLAIAGDLRANLYKIHHHGGRASAIVKGMLEHSRTSAGDMQPTDLNTLVDEYLRLAYHGARAKDKDFTCELVTHFDSSISQINVIPQEIGRVLLNLFSNAFYAVRARQQQTDSSYQPTVTITTLKTPEGVQIRVADNGTGMSESVQQKIFQPFFTTKPAGEGTGLGLSLSYDIITKGNGGSLQVESQQGKGTEFVMSLPT